VHGANRLASNSLLECLVFGGRAALAGVNEPDSPIAPTVSMPVTDEPLSRATRRDLWQAAGLTRDGTRLERLLDAPSPLVRLVAASALLRTESRGVHFRSDYPSEDERFASTHVVIENGLEPWLESWS
jgi:L-aspartate oxidase